MLTAYFSDINFLKILYIMINDFLKYYYPYFNKKNNTGLIDKS